MRRTTRHVIAVVVVATALCASDRAASASLPRDVRSQPQPGLARALAQKLTRGLRQSVRVVRVEPARTGESSRAVPLVIREEASGVRAPLSILEFPLPPPIR